MHGFPTTSSPPHFSPVHAIAVVNIARLTGCDILLPPALAVCCTLSARELLRGFKRTDGTRETLSPDDLERCIDGSSNLMLASTKISLSAFSPFYSDGCRTEDECQRGIRELLHSYKYHPDIVANDHSFGSWAMYLGGGGLSLADGDIHICSLCQEMLKVRISTEQWLVWRNLPYHLGITVDGCSGRRR